jgi:hypothetical protein
MFSVGKPIPRHRISVKWGIIAEDCDVTDVETYVNKKVTRYPASPAGGGCRALARQVGMCREGYDPPDRLR